MAKAPKGAVLAHAVERAVAWAGWVDRPDLNPAPEGVS